jgi:hypothetical protein
MAAYSKQERTFPLASLKQTFYYALQILNPRR